MAKAKKRSKRYIPIGKATRKQISEFSKFVPSLAKHKGKSRLTPAEYSAFTRAKKRLRHTDNLKPLTELQAKRLKGKLVGGGVRAIRLRNTASDKNVKIKSVLSSGVVITTNGRDWEYHPIHADGMDLPEALIEKGRELFNRKVHPPWQMHLWTSKGRANRGQSSFRLWVEYVMKEFGKYQDATDFIQGIAILTRESRGYRPEIKKKSKPFEMREQDGDEDQD